MKENIAKKYQNMQNDLQKKYDKGNLGSLTVNEFFTVCSLGKELLKHHAVKTFIKNVADYFQSFGFMVTMDFDNVNYVIAEV